MRRDYFVGGMILLVAGAFLSMVSYFSMFGCLMILLPIVGMIFMIAGAVLPGENEAPRDVMGHPMSPLFICPYCGSPTRWIPKRQRYYCYTCQMYL